MLGSVVPTDDRKLIGLVTETYKGSIELSTQQSSQSLFLQFGQKSWFLPGLNPSMKDKFISSTKLFSTYKQNFTLSSKLLLLQLREKTSIEAREMEKNRKREILCVVPFVKEREREREVLRC